MSNLLEDPLKKLTTPAPAVSPAAAGVRPLTAPNTATTALPKTGLGAGLPGAANDSVASMVKQLTSQDSALMQQAKTEGLKVANRRGLLNSSMAVGASQDAMISKALPIAAQDANQNFQKNMQASEQGWQSGEKALDRTQQADLAKAQRDLDLTMQGNSITAQNQQQIRDIASREGMDAAGRALQELMQGKDISSREGMAAADRNLQTTLQGSEIKSREGLAAAERDLQSSMQGRDIASREGLAAADRAQQTATQQREIAYQTAERGLDRGMQEKLASWNLKSTDRNAAAQLLSNMQASYQDSYSAIMANTNLDADTREAQLVSARTQRDKNLNLVEQMYVIDLTW